MADKQKTQSFSTLSMLTLIVLSCMMMYWHLAPWMAARGHTYPMVNEVFLLFREFLAEEFQMKLLILVFTIGAAALRTGRKKDFDWTTAVGYALSGTLLLFVSPRNAMLYCLLMIVSVGLAMYGYGMMFRRRSGGDAPEEDSFLQCDEKIESEYSVNIPYHYTYQKKFHKAWINIVAPFRASMILGVPGSGKSFAIFNKCIEDTVRKGYTVFMYDYKYPTLTEELLTEIHYQRRHEGLWKDEKNPPKFYVLNFDDPKRSNRCNPIDASYITDPADTTEIADLIFKNINKGSSKGGFDFFNESAKVYLDAVVYWLANYDPDAIYEEDADGRGRHIVGSSTNYERKGCYCTFPHVIEMMAYNYQKTFQILQFTKGLEAKVSPFASALEGGAMEQLQGQIASAQIPMGRFVSPALYWVMSGNDFTLDLNNPEEPKIICMGNNPDRQTIYGSAIALYTSRMFKLINHVDKRHSAVFFDELPTVFIKGLDNLIATARSNYVAIFLGAQDRSQLKRDYGEDEAKVIFNTVGSVLSGQVNEETAEQLSKMFGKEFRKQSSQSLGDESDSTSISYQLQEILPPSKISTLTQGTFFGRLADDFNYKIDRKLFCGAIDVDLQRPKEKKKEWQKVPIITDFFDGKTPQMSPADRDRLEKMYPKLAKKEEKLLEKYMDEKVKEVIDANFNKIKQEVHDFVEKEFEGTAVYAERHAAEMKQGDDSPL